MHIAGLYKAVRTTYTVVHAATAVQLVSYTVELPKLSISVHKVCFDLLTTWQFWGNKVLWHRKNHVWARSISFSFPYSQPLHGQSYKAPNTKRSLKDSPYEKCDAMGLRRIDIRLVNRHAWFKSKYCLKTKQKCLIKHPWMSRSSSLISSSNPDTKCSFNTIRLSVSGFSIEDYERMSMFIIEKPRRTPWQVKSQPGGEIKDLCSNRLTKA